MAAAALAALAVVGGAAATAPASAAQTGSVTLVDKTWICKSRVDLTSVSVTFDQNVADSSTTPGGHDAVHLGSGCTGHIGSLTVVQYHGDGVKVGGGSHDLVIDQGSIRCYAHDVGKHQDGIQAMGGTNVRFNRMDIQCNSSNNAAFFVNQGTNSPELPTGVVCAGCFLQGGGITVRIGNSVSSGVLNSAVVPGHISAVRIDAAGATDPVYANNTVGVSGAGITSVHPPAVLAVKRVSASSVLPLHVTRRGMVALVTTRISSNLDATLTVTVTPAAGGAPVSMLPQSRVGAAVTGTRHARIIAAASAGTAVALALRMPNASLRPKRLYRMTISAVAAGGGRFVLKIPIRA